LRSILEYIAQDKPQAAQRFVSLLEEQCHRLASFPSVGTERNDLLPSLRVLSFRGYGIFFTVSEEVVLILRVLSPGQDARSAHIE
jgi:toxin ParE1/3/4